MATFAVTTLVAAAVLMGLLAFWAFYPYKTITQEPKPFEIYYPIETDGTHIIRQGSSFSYSFNYTKHTDVFPTIYRQFVDGLVFNAGESYPTVIRKGTGKAHIQVYVPETLPPGKYRLRIIARYQMNPIRVIELESFTEYFKVVAKDK
jgi:hypothetical protein